MGTAPFHFGGKKYADYNMILFGFWEYTLHFYRDTLRKSEILLTFTRILFGI
ncbi:hypothetical protein J1TS3_19080 [Siminovitchia fordii]|uniref:Uncharacterized protein n=1 Tax=Siminovitchia fordii TaxID=254759 RepID=A0ABQ4K4W7_9BACI|nr:hypothetical protein J1TS3_19080 [Siminovitchia fordii]